MNFFSENAIKISILIYIVIVAVLIYLKPEFFYINNNTKNKKLKVFGTGMRKYKTIFPLWFALIVLAIIIYSLVCLLGNRL